MVVENLFKGLLVVVFVGEEVVNTSVIVEDFRAAVFVVVIDGALVVVEAVVVSVLVLV